MPLGITNIVQPTPTPVAGHTMHITPPRTGFTHRGPTMPTRFISIIAVLFVLASVGCQSTYFGAMEMVGVHKRDILVDRVESARDKQADAKEQFASALEQFKSVVAFDGGDLEQMYDQLNGEYERSKSAAQGVSSKIDSVESVAEALFTEWESELDDYSDASLRSASERQLDDTRDRCAQMVRAMRSAEESMQPVLDALKDQVLFLKHNLNAQAIASIQGTATGIQRDIEKLIVEMEKSIAEADAFIEQMSGQ